MSPSAAKGGLALPLPQTIMSRVTRYLQAEVEASAELAAGEGFAPWAAQWFLLTAHFRPILSKEAAAGPAEQGMPETGLMPAMEVMAELAELAAVALEGPSVRAPERFWL